MPASGQLHHACGAEAGSTPKVMGLVLAHGQPLSRDRHPRWRPAFRPPCCAQETQESTPPRLPGRPCPAQAPALPVVVHNVDAVPPILQRPRQGQQLKLQPHRRPPRPQPHLPGGEDQGAPGCATSHAPKGRGGQVFANREMLDQGQEQSSWALPTQRGSYEAHSPSQL